MKKDKAHQPFWFKKEDLAPPCKTALAVLRMVDEYVEYRGEVKTPGLLHLHDRHWEAINNALKRHKDHDMDLSNATYGSVTLKSMS